MINPIDIEDQNHGGSSYFHNGKLVDELAKEKGMDKVKANIYSFNIQSQRMFKAVGFTQTDDEWFECDIC
ncbi:N-acetyltransferase [Butyrivibrio fibrisolvens]|uniref:N-acetyltransferase n=1 Tax=Butyrivibrio fibrisolvens TaxID=831 RepID=UPI0003B2EE0F|nr:N-acetyltransferase [Butyrivibrio fibrisolvens]